MILEYFNKNSYTFTEQRSACARDDNSTRNESRAKQNTWIVCRPVTFSYMWAPHCGELKIRLLLHCLFKSS